MWIVVVAEERSGSVQVAEMAETNAECFESLSNVRGLWEDVAVGSSNVIRHASQIDGIVRRLRQIMVVGWVADDAAEIRISKNPDRRTAPPKSYLRRAAFELPSPQVLLLKPVEDARRGRRLDTLSVVIIVRWTVNDTPCHFYGN